ncbi:PepSY-associated TM helix domain-containing protein [Spongiibacter tropicus]
MWAGLAGLAILLVAAVTGTALVYQKELIATVVTPDAALPAHYSHSQLASELGRLADQRGIDPALKLKAPSPLEPYWTVRHDDSLELLSIGSLEPYVERLWFLELMAFIRELHVDLLSGELGEALLLISGILALFLCISGLILWWPGRRAFRWRWVFPKKIRPSQWLQYHRHSGALTSPLMLLILLTGSLMLWQKLIFPLLPPGAVFPANTPAPASADNAIAEGYLHIQQQLPDSWPTYITLSEEQGAPSLKVRVRLNGEWHLNGRSTVWLNTHNGELRRTEHSDQMAVERRLINQLYPLHSGFGMNAIYRLLTLFCGIVLTWLAVTGGLHYYKRWKHQRRRTR